MGRTLKRRRRLSDGQSQHKKGHVGEFVHGEQGCWCQTDRQTESDSQAGRCVLTIPLLTLWDFHNITATSRMNE